MARSVVATEDVLPGMACPVCGQNEMLNLTGTTTFFGVTPTGTDQHGDIEWEDNGFASCDGCGWNGKVRDTYISLSLLKETAGG
jgi:hypothetical protein